MEYATVLGGTGLLGKATTDALLKRGFSVKILVRSVEKYKEMYIDGKIPGRVDVIEGEIDSNIALATALEYSDTVFFCYNTEYKQWESDLPRWTSKIGDLCATTQAKIIYPGCVINYGANTQSPITEESDQNTSAEKGQLKIALEQRLGTSSTKGATLVIVRMPELFGFTDNDQIISQIFKAAIDKKPAYWYGDPNLTHEFLFAEDAAEALVNIAISEKTNDTMINLSGHRVTPDQFIRLIYDNVSIIENPPYHIKNKFETGIKAILSKKQAQLNELLYVYSHELLLDNSKYQKIIGEQKLTDLKESIVKTLNWFQYWYSQ